VARRDHARPLTAALVVALSLFVACMGDAGAQLALTSPKWSDLTPQERAILAPLAPPQWDTFDARRKEKWRGLAKRYPTMTPQHQARMREQMKTWATLSPEERRTAREKYQAMKKLPPDQRAEMQRKWDEYRKLSPEQRAAIRGHVPAARRDGTIPVPTPGATSAPVGGVMPGVPAPAGAPSPPPAPAGSPAPGTATGQAAAPAPAAPASSAPTPRPAG
jgi:hypothetical protein